MSVWSPIGMMIQVKFTYFILGRIRVERSLHANVHNSDQKAMMGGAHTHRVISPTSVTTT